MSDRSSVTPAIQTLCDCHAQKLHFPSALEAGSDPGVTPPSLHLLGTRCLAQVCPGHNGPLSVPEQLVTGSRDMGRVQPEPWPSEEAD